MKQIVVLYQGILTGTGHPQVCKTNHRCGTIYAPKNARMYKILYNNFNKLIEIFSYEHITHGSIFIDEELARRHLIKNKEA
jgi:predicted nucleotidyltransferase